MIKVGVVENQDETTTIDILAQLCKSSGKKVSILKEYNDVYRKNYSFLSYINELIKNNMDMVIIHLSQEGLKNKWFKDINFDIIIYSVSSTEKENADFPLDDNKFFLTLSQDAVGIINADDKELMHFFKRKINRLVTYGFNPAACITASSIQEEEINNRIQCCVKKKLKTFSGRVLEPQEFSIRLPLNENHELYSALAAITAAMLNDIKIPDKNHS
ncbi:MAG TPA: Mur ligase family protein [Defluviitaleaceae bacterium]|nr:hypothetical protein [Candidatus Epulonipiscium sp.]HOQ17305.1 Mur ligase family protein [Defluviitaleaceae bacterium]HPT76346.1 Mur ligase family protein [Defluviitaleaceae bacterium]HQD51431.1 Mur ligase family protein [Defluviitaleaceae bacterium]